MTLSNHGDPRETPRMTRRVTRGFSAERFAAARLASGLSIGELSRLANIGQSTVHTWIAGTSTPNIDYLARVMKILNTPIEDVVLIEPDQRYPGDWRVIKGITQPELAAAAKIATTTLRGIERADIALTPANAENLAAALGISTAEYQAAYQRARTRPAGTKA